jgi:MFS family permease
MEKPKGDGVNDHPSFSDPKPASSPTDRVRLPLGGEWKAQNVVLALSLCLALQMTSFVMILPLFSRRFADFGAGVEELSASALAYALAATFAAPFMGALADRFGRRPLVLAPLAVYVLAFSGYLWAPTAAWFIALRGLAGAFTAGLIPAITGIVADLAPDDRRAQWIGILNGGASVGWIVGPIIGGMLYDRWGYTVPFGASIALAAFTLLFAFIIVPETRPATDVSAAGKFSHRLKEIPTSFKSIRSILPKPIHIFIILMIISFMVLFAWAFIEPELMFYAYDGLGWSSSQLGLTMSVYGFATMIGEFTLGRSSDRLGRKPILVLGLTLFMAQFVGLGLFTSMAAIAASFILAGLGNALFDPALTAYILDITLPDHKGSILGMKSTAGSIGSLLGPMMVMLFTSVISSQGIFLIAAVLVALIALTSLLVLKAQPTLRSSKPLLGI